ncbi:MAG: NAD(P)H-dependent oxidoreductase subunit E [Pseudomonadales bacterium]|nr:NAD(P)H-dependent oxidoreductase subunit E [Pseudomonadales bacterium]MCP5214786.1 NAD(P)H-dependent oxidoreductase subunit E [Pseudomonadales bacterium]
MFSEKQRGKPSHPGKGKGLARKYNRGRQVDTAALNEVKALLADRSRQRDLLIEHLHLIQDKYHHISARHLAALALEMNIPLAEAYEVATFYAHFDIVKEDEPVPPAITIRVCDSLSCELQGAADLQQALKQCVDPKQVRVVRAPCMGRCDTAPVAEIGHRHIDLATADKVMAGVSAKDFSPKIPVYQSYQEYLDKGGYQIYKDCLNGKKTYEQLNSILAESGLRGLGGAGFPTATKWSFVRKEAKPRLLAVNADEGEPGTFKDRYYLERKPHQFLEGMLISAWAVEAETIYIYLRDEYPAIREILLKEIALLETEQLITPGYIRLRRGAGAYICGEESAMIESIEGKRGYPRQRPPYVAQVGLFNRPTLVNNVETLYWLQPILEQGPELLTKEGRHGRTGLRSFSVSGRVQKPGVKLAPAGITMKELIDEYCGGMAPGHQFKGYLPGGPSGGILPAHMDNIPLDFGTLEEYGCLIGSAAIVVLSNQDKIRDVTLNLLRFFEDESCGQCTPCRVGTEKTAQLLEQDTWDVERLNQLKQVMCDASICGLGQAASNPVSTALKYFNDEIITRG